MKKVVSTILVLILCLGMTACSGDIDIPEGYKLISTDDVAYRFFAPTQWSENTGTGNKSAYYSIEDRSMVMVTAYLPAENYNNIEAFWNYIEGQYKEKYIDYEFIEESAAVLGERNAHRYTFTANIGGGDYKVMQVIAPQGSYYYMFTYTSTPENFEAHVEEVNGMIGVFEFR